MSGWFSSAKISLAQRASDCVKEYRVKRSSLLEKYMTFVKEELETRIINAASTKGCLSEEFDVSSFKSADGFEPTADELVDIMEKIKTFLLEEDFKVEIHMNKITISWADPTPKVEAEAEPTAEAEAEAETEAKVEEAEEPKVEKKTT